jgi:type IV secretion system protein VirB4
MGFNVQKERTATEYVPYTLHLANDVVATKDDDVITTLKVQGAAYDTLTSEELNGQDGLWKATLGSLARGGRTALWTHLIRRKVTYNHALEYTNGFSQSLADAYAERLSKKDFFTNDLYLSTVYRPNLGSIEGLANKLNKSNQSDYKASRLKAVQEVLSVTNRLEQALRKLSPTRLTIENNDNGHTTSQNAGFFAEILNGRPVEIPARRNAVSYAIQLSELNFGHEVIEIAGSSSSKLVALLGLKSPYSVEILRADVLRPLFNAPLEFILSQSLTFMPTSKADKFLETQLAQYESTQGTELLQTQMLEARMRLQAGQFSMCNHDFVLAIYGNSPEELNKSIQLAEAALIEKSVQVIRHSRGTLLASYFAMLPGNFTTGRITAQPLSSDNFASFFPLHNNMVGMAKGSQWGMPVAIVETPQGAPYFLNFHNSKKDAAEMGLDLGYSEDEVEGQGGKEQRKENGNARFIGNAGDGKTVAQTFLRSMLQKKNTVNGPYTSYAFDNDLGQMIYINAIGGRYFEFANGQPTGINPFSLEDTPRNREYILAQYKWCAKQDETYLATAFDEKRLADSIGFVYTQSEQKRFGRVLDQLDAGSPLHIALSRWCGDGPYAWVLDSKVDRFDLAAYRAFGFDMTDFLKNPMARTPILWYLFYKINSNRDGKQYSIDIDEAGIALSDPDLRAQITSEARTIRKKNGILTLATQNPLDLSAASLGGTLVHQLPTSFFFPNTTAEGKEYASLGCTLKEYELIKSKMAGKPGTILFKKGNRSAVIQLDLSGMGDYLAVLSGSYDNVAVYRDVKAELGEDAPPSIWLPEFYRRRK